MGLFIHLNVIYFRPRASLGPLAAPGHGTTGRMNVAGRQSWQYNYAISPRVAEPIHVQDTLSYSYVLL